MQTPTTVSIRIDAPSGEAARIEMRKLLGEDVHHSGPAQQAFAYEVQKDVPSSGKPDPRKGENTGDGGDDTPDYPLEKLLGETIKVIKGKLPGLTAAELRDLAAYEEAGKDRATLLKAIQDEIDSRTDQAGGDDTGLTGEAKANTGLDDDEPEQKAAPDPEASAKASEEEAVAAGHEGDEPDQPSLEDCREIGRKVQRLDNGTEMLRELLADIGATNLSDAHAKDKGAAFVAGCEKILAEKGE